VLLLDTTFRVCLEFGEIVNFAFTPGNTDDRNEELMKKLTKNISGKLIGDKGYSCVLN